MTLKKQGSAAKAESQAIALQSKSAPIATVKTADQLIAQAIEKKTPVETMEKLLAMRKELKAEWAKEQFDEAMAKFQGDCPVIEKTKDGATTKSGKVAYKYAPLDVIVSQTKSLIQANGFSYMIQTETLPAGVKVTCIVKHKSGHSELSTVEVPMGTKTDIMNASQQVASALTFAKRYAFCNAFGILTGDEDDDSLSVPASQQVASDRQNNYQAPAKAAAPSQPDPNLAVDQQKNKICVAVTKLVGYQPKSADEYRELVSSMTSLELKEENYTTIIDRLTILIDESKGAEPAKPAAPIEGELIEPVTTPAAEPIVADTSPIGPMKKRMIEVLALQKKVANVNDAIPKWINWTFELDIEDLSALTVEQGNKILDHLQKMEVSE